MDCGTLRLMWSYDDFLAKAKLYMARAAQHDRADDEFALWLLLGLEFLLRAPLAQVHPTLLASPEGPSLLDAAGFSDPTREPKSVAITTVLERLKVIVPSFSQQRFEDASFLINLRNAEVHT